MLYAHGFRKAQDLMQSQFRGSSGRGRDIAVGGFAGRGHEGNADLGTGYYQPCKSMSQFGDGYHAFGTYVIRITRFTSK